MEDFPEFATARAVDRRETDAYAEGRADEFEECKVLMAWAYSKLHYRSFDSMEDALKLDEIKLKFMQD